MLPWPGVCVCGLCVECVRVCVCVVYVCVCVCVWSVCVCLECVFTLCSDFQMMTPLTPR